MGPCLYRHRGWDHFVSRRRQLNVWPREQEQRDEQCFSDAASCQTGSRCDAGHTGRSHVSQSHGLSQQLVKLDLLSCHFRQTTDLSQMCHRATLLFPWQSVSAVKAMESDCSGYGLNGRSGVDA